MAERLSVVCGVGLAGLIIDLDVLITEKEEFIVGVVLEKEILRYVVEEEKMIQVVSFYIEKGGSGAFVLAWLTLYLA